MSYKATERLYVNADRTKIVPEHSSEAAFLLAAEGKELPDDVAERYGLTKRSAKSAPKPEDKAMPEPPNKASGVTITKSKGK